MLNALGSRRSAFASSSGRYGDTMSLLRSLPVLVAFLVVGGPRDPTTLPIVPETIRIVSTPVTVQPDNPSRVRVGALTLLAGWKLESESHQFGGWSSLDVQGDRVTTVSDGGAVLRFRLGRFGHASEAAIVAVPHGCGPDGDKRDRDTESLARDPASGDWLIGYEWRNVICRMTGNFARALRLRQPPEMTNWPKTTGAESMLRLPDGRFIVIAEHMRGDDPRALLIFDRDPTDAAAQVARAVYVPPKGYDPTDAALLPDGRILVMNRRFSPFSLFTCVLASIDAAAIEPGATLVGKPLANFSPPVLSDNYEGLSVTVDATGTPILWVISDDNFMSWQGSYLLKFAVDPVPQAAAAVVSTRALAMRRFSR